MPEKNPKEKPREALLEGYQNELLEKYQDKTERTSDLKKNLA